METVLQSQEHAKQGSGTLLVLLPHGTVRLSLLRERSALSFVKRTTRVACGSMTEPTQPDQHITTRGYERPHRHGNGRGVST
jgi:hypothetical protein